MMNKTFIGTFADLPANPAAGEVVMWLPINKLFIFDGLTWKPLESAEDAPWWDLFLDDERNPADVKWTQLSVSVARTVDQAIAMIESNGLPRAISFDHDLGENEPTSMKLMWWLINGHLDEKHDCGRIEEIQIHTANPEGAKNLIGLWTGFAKQVGLTTNLTRVRALEKK